MVAPYATLAPLYDALLGKRFFGQLRIVFEQLAGRYSLRFQSVADVACGTGAFVRYLCKRGVPVVYGVDRSAAMLRIAFSRNRGNGSLFLQQDLTGLRLPQPVDLITCNFDSLNYLTTPAALLLAFHRFRANLNPGGWLIFDMITPHQPWTGARPMQEKAIIQGTGFRRWMRMDPKSGVQVSHLILKRDGQTFLEVHRQRAYPIHLLRKLLCNADFRTLGVHDFNGLGQVSPRTRRAVFVARKPGRGVTIRIS